MRGSHRFLFLSSLSLLVFSSFVPYKDKHYVDYFLHRYAADLYHQKQFNLDYLRVYYGWKTIDRIYFEFSCFRSLSLKDARALLIETANGIVEKINKDPLLNEKDMLLGGHFCIKQLNLEITAENIFARTTDDSGGIKVVSLEDGVITYETFNSSVFIPKDRKIFREEYRDAELLVLREKGKGIGFEIEDQLDKALQSAKDRRTAEIKGAQELQAKKQKEAEGNKAEFHVPRAVEYPIEKFNSLFGERPAAPPQVVTIEDLNYLNLPPREKPVQTPVAPANEETPKELPVLPAVEEKKTEEKTLAPQEAKPQEAVPPQEKQSEPQEQVPLPVHLVPLAPSSVPVEKQDEAVPQNTQVKAVPVKEEEPTVAPLPGNEVPQDKAAEPAKQESLPAPQGGLENEVPKQAALDVQESQLPLSLVDKSVVATDDTSVNSFLKKIGKLLWKTTPEKEVQSEMLSQEPQQEKIEKEQIVATEEKIESVVDEYPLEQQLSDQATVSVADPIEQALPQQESANISFVFEPVQAQVDGESKPIATSEKAFRNQQIKRSFWQRIRGLFAGKEKEQKEISEAELVTAKTEPQPELKPESRVQSIVSELEVKEEEEKSVVQTTEKTTKKEGDKIVADLATEGKLRDTPFLYEYTEEDVISALQEDFSLEALLEKETSPEKVQESYHSLVDSSQFMQEDFAAGMPESIESVAFENDKEQKEPCKEVVEALPEIVIQPEITTNKPEVVAEVVLFQGEAKPFLSEPSTELKLQPAQEEEFQQARMEAEIEDTTLQEDVIERADTDFADTSDQEEMAPYELASEVESVSIAVENGSKESHEIQKSIWQRLSTFFAIKREEEAKSEPLQTEQVEAIVQQVPGYEPVQKEEPQQEVVEVEIQAEQDRVEEDAIEFAVEDDREEIAPYEQASEIENAPIALAREADDEEIAPYDAEIEDKMIQAELIEEDNQEDALSLAAQGEEDEEVLAPYDAESQIEQAWTDGKVKKDSFWDSLKAMIFPQELSSDNSQVALKNVGEAQDVVLKAESESFSFSTPDDSFENSVEIEGEEDDDETMISDSLVPEPELPQDFLVAEDEDVIEEEYRKS